MQHPIAKQYNIILASQSPRRQELIKGLNIPFTIKTKNIAEDYSEALVREQIPLFLSKKKAKAFELDLMDRDLLITADTIVWVDNGVLGKPNNKQHAIEMLKTLSGNKHTVYTGVCIKTKTKEKVFWSSTDVFFRALSLDEIVYYVEQYQPFDKAGSYGIQEWIGYIGIEKIEGSYFNVMGLPVQKLYDELLEF